MRLERLLWLLLLPLDDSVNSIASTHDCFLNHSSHIFELFSDNHLYHQVFLHLKEVSFLQERDICFILQDHLTSQLNTHLIYWSPIPLDRSCLIHPPMPPERTQSVYHGDMNLEAIAHFINENALKFRNIDGSLSPLGESIEASLQQMHRVSNGDTCDSVDLSDLKSSIFEQNYLVPQRPLIIRNFMNVANMSLINLLSHYLSRKVGVKLSPSSSFEGVDDIRNWGMESRQKVPDFVLAQLASTDKVIVRAAHEDMTLDEFFSLIRIEDKVGEQCERVHAYVEYLPVSYYLPGLLESLPTLSSHSSSIFDSFIDGKAYLWLGDGNTTGKWHFDPYDNVLIQLEGSKTFFLTDTTHNRELREGHMREAQLRIKGTESRRFCQFEKDTLLESTSIVHTPILMDGTSTVKDVPIMNCTVHEGDALFVPSFWWHEVVSTPGPSQTFQEKKIRLNAAINYWFEPLYTKEFPCAECSKHLNMKYRTKLKSIFLDNT